MRNRLDRRRPQIDPKTLRKHSGIVAKQQDDLKVVGNRVQTDYGFTVTGFTGKFETFFMYVVPAAATPSWKHDKKTRVYRVNSGLGYYMTWDESGNATSRQITAGDEVIATPGIQHKIGTTGKSTLEVFVCQESKYDAHLVEVEPAITQDVAAELLEPVSEDGRVVFGQTRYRSSRAAEQIAAQRGEPPVRGRGRRDGPDVDTFMRSGVAGVNAMPVMNFNDDGAG